MTSLWQKETEEEKAIADAKYQRLVKVCARMYICLSAPMKEYEGIGNEEKRSRALQEHLAEEEKEPVWRMARAMEEHIKSSFPPDLVEALAPSPARSRSRPGSSRSRRCPSSSREEREEGE